MLPKSTSFETFKVVYDRKSKNWAVMREGQPLSGGYSKKKLALNYAKKTARNRDRNSEIKVYKTNGSFQKKMKFPKKDSKSSKSSDSKSGSYIGRKKNEFF